jgi:hypothetical protein
VIREKSMGGKIRGGRNREVLVESILRYNLGGIILGKSA